MLAGNVREPEWITRDGTSMGCLVKSTETSGNEVIVAIKQNDEMIESELNIAVRSPLVAALSPTVAPAFNTAELELSFDSIGGISYSY